MSGYEKRIIFRSGNTMHGVHGVLSADAEKRDGVSAGGVE